MCNGGCSEFEKHLRKLERALQGAFVLAETEEQAIEVINKVIAVLPEVEDNDGCCGSCEEGCGGCDGS